MSEPIELEEEEFDATFSGQTVRRLVRLLRPYTLWVAGFLTTVLMVSGLDSYFTYLSKRMVDEGITAGNWDVLVQIVEQYAALVVIQAGAVFVFIYLAGLLGERIRYDLRQRLFNHLQALSLTY
ncbi:MAG TPA: ABC transporter transmembrane domain-containing protein, partial [Caldilinea sp.]|nr:ABC transporter transmembrane domain-containing protein [Caldilinea sp.]